MYNVRDTRYDATRTTRSDERIIMPKVPGPTEWLRQQRTTAAAATTPAPPTCAGEDAIDSQIERFLQLHGVKYAPKAQIPIDLIDEKSSLSNQARSVPIIQESVDRFATAIREGKYLPPVIVYPNGQRVTIVDGNNRHGGHKKAGSRFIPGYVIAEDTPSETIQLLTVAANNGHGVTPDVKWRVRQAALLVALGFTSERACEAAGVTKGQLGDYSAASRADARAKQMRITTGWADLPAATRITLGRFPYDAVFYQAARCAIDTGLDSDTMRHLLKDVKALGSENEQVAFVAKFAEDRKLEARARNATGGQRVKSPKQALITSIGMIMHMDPAELARHVVTDIDRALLIKRIDAAVDKLAELEGALVAGKVVADAR